MHSNLDLVQKQHPWKSLGRSAIHSLGADLPTGIALKFRPCLRALIIAYLGWLSTSLQAEAAEQAHGPDPVAFPVRNGLLRAEVARIEKIGREFMLTTYCGETQSIYLQQTAAIDLREYLNHYVRVTYATKEVTQPHIKCVLAPCGPVTVAKAVILEIEKTDTTDERLSNLPASCTPIETVE
ncbi:MAG: hypothetical protein ACREVH_00855 [Gammaproteobacteria bacterium]